jgi:threonine/homoserine/homoserine lactone efflux protein|tara:strand:- start:871 stop:1497 length:627 start_codon:yes stop_codon:yes gene_type:complete
LEINIILALTIAGITLGIVEGIKPGPLLTMVIRETLSNGRRAGIWTAAAPIFTDGPLIIISLFAANWFSTRPMFLAIISIIGSIFLLKMGIECFSIEPPDSKLDDIDYSKSLKRGILTNLLNPNVYIFWFLIGGPLMASVVDKEPLAPIAYAISFLISIIIVKTTIAYFFDKTRGNISIKTYRIFLSICGVTMIIFAFGFLNQAIILL